MQKYTVPNTQTNNKKLVLVFIQGEINIHNINSTSIYNFLSRIKNVNIWLGLD